MFNFFKRFARDDSPRGRALTAIEAGDYAAAEEMLTALLGNAILPADRALYQNKRGIARMYAGRRDDALDDFRGALEHVPNYPPSLTNIGNALLEDGAIDDAIAHYQSAIRYDDEYAVAHLNLGVAYKRVGRHEEAVKELRRGHRLEGGFFGKPRKRR